MYVATDAGVLTLRSDDGMSWKVESHGLQDWSIFEIAVPPSTPNRAYAATRGDGIWSTEDFGKSWKKPCYGKPGPGKARCVTLDPHDPNTIFAGTEPIEIFVSDDSGKSWDRLDSIRQVPWVETVQYPLPAVEPHIRDIVIHPKDSKTIYAALQVGYILMSHDRGKSWKLLDKGLDSDVHTIVISPEDTDTMFAATGGHDCRKGRAAGRALYMTTDGGESWVSTAAEYSQEYSVPLVMHPEDPKILYSAVASGHPGLWRRPTGAESLIIRTSDAGRTWQKLDNGPAELRENFAFALAIDQHKPRNVYAALGRGVSGEKMGDGDLFASTDGGDSWAKTGVKIPSVFDMKCAQA
jgi:photosystem II stability/assembly factor-like uncharacterized protein